MTNDLAVMLIGRLAALIGAPLLGSFVMWRIHRHGRVFNWPPVLEKSTPPAANRGDK